MDVTCGLASGGMPLPPNLPTPADKRLAVRLTPDARRQVVAGHPWVYAESISSLSARGAPGDLAVVFDDKRKFVAIGLYDPGSPIRLKILHRGAPAPIDASFWQGRLDAALERRAPLAATDTTGYRCVHGENDGFPGLVLDRYADTLVLKLYSAAWVPHLAAVLPVIVATLRPRAVVLRLARALQGTPAMHGLEDGAALYGEAPGAPVLYRELGLQFEADVIDGQKTGAFLDQRDNRALVGSLAAGASVLDVFASTGGFGVHAAAGGATSVLSVDASAGALAAAQRNMHHNRRLPAVAACSHTIEEGDAFEVMDRFGRQHRKFDIVVVDPPSFAQRQSNVPRALGAYAQLTEKALRLVAPDGLLVQASCSSRVTADEFVATVRGAAGRAGWDLRILRQTGQPIDHPIGFAQGAYLKALFARPFRP